MDLDPIRGSLFTFESFWVVLQVRAICVGTIRPGLMVLFRPEKYRS